MLCFCTCDAECPEGAAAPIAHEPKLRLRRLFCLTEYKTLAAMVCIVTVTPSQQVRAGFHRCNAASSKFYPQASCSSVQQQASQKLNPAFHSALDVHLPFGGPLVHLLEAAERPRRHALYTASSLCTAMAERAHGNSDQDGLEMYSRYKYGRYKYGRHKYGKPAVKTDCMAHCAQNLSRKKQLLYTRMHRKSAPPLVMESGINTWDWRTRR